MSAYIPVPTRYPSGVTSFRPEDTLARMPTNQGMHWHMLRFRGNGAENPNFTNTLASTGTAVLGNAVLGGGWLMTTAATANDTVQSQIAGAACQFAPGFPCGYQARVELDSLTLSRFIHGLQNTNTNATTATDGVWFDKPAGGSVVNLVVSRGGVQQVTSSIIDLATLFANGSYTANISGGAVASITVNSQPTGIIKGVSALVTLTGGGGSGATAVMSTSASGVHFTIINPGSGYTSSPTVGLIPQVPMGFWWDAKGNTNTMYYGIGTRPIGSISNPNLPYPLLSPVAFLEASTAAVRIANFTDVFAGGYTPY